MAWSSRTNRAIPRYFPLDEDYDVDPMDSYALSKVVNEKTARAFALRSGADIYALRIGNVIEPHEYELFPKWFADPGFRKRIAWSYIDARDLGQMTDQAVEKRRARLSGLQRRQRRHLVGPADPRTARPLLPRRAGPRRARRVRDTAFQPESQGAARLQAPAQLERPCRAGMTERRHWRVDLRGRRLCAAPDAARFAGSSVHASLASEIGLSIVRGDYPPGTILPNEAKWAEMFDVSRSAVREAIKMLMAKGLLSSRPKIGSWVEPRERWNLLDRDVLGWYAASPNRGAVPPHGAGVSPYHRAGGDRLAAARRSDDEMEDISRALRDMDEAATLQERTAADTRFHVAILRASGNELLVPLGVLIEQALNHLFVYVTREVNSLRHVQKLHADIERNIRLMRPAAARSAVRRLLANTDGIIGRKDVGPS